LICDNSNQECLQIHNIPRDDELFVCETLDDSLLEEFYRFLTRLFPQLEHLVVNYDFSHPFSNLPLLLAQCRGLLSLSLTGHVFHHEIYLISHLLQAINSLPALKSLNLLAANLFITEDLKSHFPIEMHKTLYQLEHLSLSGYKGNLLQVLSQLGPNLRSLRLDLIPDIESEFVQTITHNIQLTQNVTHLRISLEKLQVNHRELLYFICDNFQQLKFLDFQSCPLMNFGMVMTLKYLLINLFCL